MFISIIQPRDLADTLKDFNNPVYYSLLGIIIILFVVYFFYRYIIIPLNKKHLLEKEDLEIKRMRLMGLFADLDPDPVIRVDSKGQVIYLNDAASLKQEFSRLIESNMSEFLPTLNIQLDDLIEKNSDYTFSTEYFGRYYLISLRGNSYLHIAQIYFHDITDRKRFEERLKLSQKKLKALSYNLMNLIEEERDRIATELHDSIGQNLLFIKLKLQNVAPIDSKEFDSLAELFEEVINDLRKVIYNLKPKILEEMGLAPALIYLCDRVSQESKIEGKIDIVGYENRMSHKKELALFRIAQESISNIVKHSGAKEFSIQLIGAPNKIRMIISDDGKGFDLNILKQKNGKPDSTGYGLMNIRERISQLNGIFKVDSSINMGTVLITEIPLGAKNEK